MKAFPCDEFCPVKTLSAPPGRFLLQGHARRGSSAMAGLRAYTGINRIYD
jgi:hypothetical protein